MFKMTIPIEPVPQMRARSMAYRAKDGVIRARTYKSGKQADAETTLIAHLIERCKALDVDPIIIGPIWLGVRVYRSIPSSWSQKKRLAALSGDIRPDGKPDLDNYIKCVKDCITGTGKIWRDDRQVVEYLPNTGKYYSDRPRWEITVMSQKELEF